MEKELEAGLDDPNDLKVTSARSGELFATFAHLLGAELELDPSISGDVTLNLENAPCRGALDAVCNQVGCSWKLVEGAEKPLLQVKPKR